MRKADHHPKTRWHQVYYFLAAIDISTISFSLYLSHKILALHEESTRVNSEWVARLETYENISSIAAQVNAPGNDVFDNQDPTGERVLKNAALKTFDAAILRAKKDIDGVPNSTQRQEILAQITAIDKSMYEMNSEAELIFTHFEKKDPTSAGQRMATMDRKFAQLNTNLSSLRGMVRNYQRENLRSQHEQAAAIGYFEFFIGLTVLGIVVAVVIYGRYLNRRIEEDNSLIAAQRESLEASVRMASLGTMSAGIAHEINNPVAVIQGHAELLMSKAKSGPIPNAVIIASSERIVLTCKRISAIIKGLRTLARDGVNDDIAKASLLQILDDSIALCQSRFKKKNVELRFVRPAVDIEIECRQVQICQCIVNLLDNAYDAVAENESPWVELGVKTGSVDKVEIYVMDSGTGIDKEVAKKIMMPFFTTKEVGKGTGLGLSISFSMIEQNGGRLFLDSNSKNTRFAISMPLHSASLKPAKKVA